MATAATVCDSCGTEPRAGARFCDSCGAPIGAAPDPAEFKQVTVLFADVVGSMGIAALVGPERLREIMAELVDGAAAAVEHYGGTVQGFTGDGIMALFGAPVALEDHALRACRAALELQQTVQRQAVDVHARDGLTLQLRVGLNSGQVVAGEMTSSAAGYTAIGEQVGMAQRMESVARPGGVMLSQSTAKLVEAAADLGEPELVRVKGRDAGVPARQLLAVHSGRPEPRRWQSTFVGRQREIDSITEAIEQARGGRGQVVRVVGPPGIGKSRFVGESTALARSGADVHVAYCEAHAEDIAFHAVANLLRTACGLIDLPDVVARQEIRSQFRGADEDDLLLLDDLLGVADRESAMPDIDPDARRRRLTALLTNALQSRPRPTIYVIEDAHWIDEVSESMLADVLTAIPRSQSMAIVSYRPEYRGALTQTAGATQITLAPLELSQASALTAELLGFDASIVQVGALITERAAGNPFFAEEIARDLADRGVLIGSRGHYVCHGDVAAIDVPATLQATIAARIDRLGPMAKRTLRAAAVVGSRFTADLLVSLGVDPAVAELVDAELIDEVLAGPQPEYAFRHPLIRTVAYESQLRADRSDLHRRLAAVIEQRDAGAIEANAALIAEHSEAAGDLLPAYGWHMRAAGWLATRDIAAARISWRRASSVADRLPDDTADITAMRIAPRTLLSASAFRVGGRVADSGFDELRDLTGMSDDKRSLSMGMSGFVMALTVHSRHRESSELASECMALFESIGDPALTVGLSFPLILAKYEAGELTEALEMAQRAIDLTDGDPTMGNLIFGSPLSLLLAIRGTLRYRIGTAGWRDDADRAVEMARANDPSCLVFAVMYKYLGIASGALLPDDTALRETAEALRLAEDSSDDFALTAARFVRGVTLIFLEGADRDAGLDLLRQTREACLRERFSTTTLPYIDGVFVKEMAAGGDLDGAIESARAILARLSDSGEMMSRAGAAATLVELLLTRGGPADFREVHRVLDSVAELRSPRYALDQMVSSLVHAFVAQAEGDETAYRNYAERFRTMATSLRAEGFMALAQALA
ncbi:adenylate cyclase [Mycobacterium sp. OAS707]|uniref:ATP-binding protein n=1 Tax=Mycobacterium sp. OAS707 TaxID=2663822 RepID=UPI00178971B0|nr:adenylate/guanylate cyclase domain-containing protein [Mycobacterium sp. OAS707]MBE1548982.1 adenylate cyclase [Mycobacterium sp. OAS707]